MMRSLQRVAGRAGPSAFQRTVLPTPSLLPSWAAKSMSQKSFELQGSFRSCDVFLPRHIGPRDEDQEEMLKLLGYETLDEVVNDAVPRRIRLESPLRVSQPLTEKEALKELRNIARKNKVFRSYIGMGYYNTNVPPVILRNLFEAPGWYTAYTPYQAECSQGRLELLLNFQTAVSELTQMDICNASLLDEATAAAEAMILSFNHHKNRTKFFAAEDCHPQTLAVLETRARGLGIELEIGNPFYANLESNEYCGILVQYPNTYGELHDYEDLAKRAGEAKTIVAAATDLLACTVLRPPGDWGADLVVGTAQRLGVPLGFGGPHAGFMAAKKELQRKLPGRIIGITKDSRGKPALRMAMQTREQHIRRDKATSNICTAQALLANMASAYCIYHGPEGLKDIAQRVHRFAVVMAETLMKEGFDIETDNFFDTIVVNVRGKGFTSDEIVARAQASEINLRRIDSSRVGIAFDESTQMLSLLKLVDVFHTSKSLNDVPELETLATPTAFIAPEFRRTTPFMQQEVFNVYRSETQMLRYLHRLQKRDLSLADSMIPLGSCTMKLNAVSEMLPVSWPEFAHIHPFAPASQWVGYDEVMRSLSQELAVITGFAAVSCQPNSGAQGEYAGLMCIRDYLKDIGQGHRNVCLIPISAHGTNPASAVMAGMKVVVVKSDEHGNMDIPDLKAKIEQNKERLAAFMVTYPSTYGVFEEDIEEVISLVHEAGGQVYMDGANMNAQVGLTSPGRIGADVCHLNLHKTFCIPHGGGGPGIGAIGVAEHLAPYLPGHPVVPCGGYGHNIVAKKTGAVSASPYGSPSILPISWMYIRMMGGSGLTKATQVAILNANYMAKRLEGHYNIAFCGKNGLVAHEFIVDLRPFKKYGITEEDVAKRLVDFGFHAPTMSWPVSGTLMVEPTESEDKAELDRFVDSLIQIRKEIQAVVDGSIDVTDSPLKHAPHTADMVCADSWSRKYSREQAAYPAPHTRTRKFWPYVGRVDNAFGDKNLVCSCPSLQSYLDSSEDIFGTK